MGGRAGCRLMNPTNPGMSFMSKAAASPPLLRLYKPRPESRSDWSEIRGRIDLAKVAAALLGLPGRKTGPAHAARWDGIAPSTGPTRRSGSIWVKRLVVFHCGAGGDAAALVMRIKSMDFRDAIAWLDEQEGFGASGRALSTTVDQRFRRERLSSVSGESTPPEIGERLAIMEGGERRKGRRDCRRTEVNDEAHAITEWGLVVSGVVSVALGLGLGRFPCGSGRCKSPCALGPDCLFARERGPALLFQRAGRRAGSPRPTGTIARAFPGSGTTRPGCFRASSTTVGCSPMAKPIWSLEVAIVVPVAVLLIAMLILWRIRPRSLVDRPLRRFAVENLQKPDRPPVLR